jgi:hypothetical protein
MRNSLQFPQKQTAKFQHSMDDTETTRSVKMEQKNLWALKMENKILQK